MEYRESIIPISISDLLPWSIYDNFRGTYLDIPILCYNPFNKTARAAWHTYPESVHPHTKRY